MAWTTPRTWTTGEIVTAALLNTNLRDNLNVTAPAVMTAQGDLLYASAANAPARLAKDANSTRSLTNTGTNNNPAWAQVALATGVSGTLPVGNGGTGATSLDDKAVLISQDSGTDTVGSVALTTSGQIIIGGSSGPTAATITAGSNITITNGDGSISIAASVSSSTQFATGSYTGNGGTSNAITGVGFQPKLLHITKKLTNVGDDFLRREWAWTSDVIIDDISGGGFISVPGVNASGDDPSMEDDGILSLDSDGFTVDDDGADFDPNANTVVYNYWAIG